MTLRQMASRVLAPLLLIAAILVGSAPAHARVDVHFHSFNGSVLFGRYPHTFVVFEGTLEDTGETIFENYGFSARVASPAVLAGPVEHIVMEEEEKYISTTNRHFTLTVSADTYRRMKAEVIAWRDAPGRFYDLNTRNCIHFVGAMAVLGGLTVDYPREMLRRPRAWLDRVTELNPQLGG